MNKSNKKLVITLSDLRMTYKEFAEYCGLSNSTVWRYFNNKGTRYYRNEDIIQNAIKELAKKKNIGKV